MTKMYKPLVRFSKTANACECMCVHQMCLIFILKIKDYFSSNKAYLTTHMSLFRCTISNVEIYET